MKKDNRFRKAKTDHSWRECDGFMIAGEWYYFKNGDVVEFKVDDKLVRRVVEVKTDSKTVLGLGYAEHLLVTHAFIKCPRKKIRITESPPLRLVA